MHVHTYACLVGSRLGQFQWSGSVSGKNTVMLHPVDDQQGVHSDRKEEQWRGWGKREREEVAL